MAGIAVLLVLAALPSLAQADLEAEAKEQVAKLGDNDWATREKAQRRLVAIGESARKALRGALEDKDLEIRARASHALIDIGETFTYSMQSARAESDGIRAHGLAALKHLLHLDDENTLRQMSMQELNQYDRGGSYQNLQISQPPVIALARIEALSGFPILVSAQVGEQWARLLETPMLTTYLSGDITRINQVRGAVENMVNSQGNRDPKNYMVVNAMRCGRKNFMYVTTRNGQFDSGPRCIDQLIGELLDGGPRMVRAASLLAEAVASDPSSRKSLQAEFIATPAIGPLYWLSNAVEGDETAAALRKAPPAEITALLASNDWVVMQEAARALGRFTPEQRAESLNARIEQTSSTLELVAALWCARGCELQEKARARLAKLLANKTDVIAAAAARWLGGAEKATDAELDAIWESAQFLAPSTSFFIVALDLVSRPDIASRLETKARAALARDNSNGTQQALGATVLKGRVNATDLTQALKRLTGAKDHALTGKLATLFTGCEKLDDDALDLFAKGISGSDMASRRRYLRALRQCVPTLRARIANLAATKLPKPLADPTKDPEPVKSARVCIDGIIAGTGDAAALDRLMQLAQGANEPMARFAGIALVDALDGEGLTSTLNNIRKQPGVRFPASVVLEAYKELCQRSAEEGDADAFRLNQAKAMAVKKEWDHELNNWLQQYQEEMRRTRADFDVKALLPRDPMVSELKLAP